MNYIEVNIQIDPNTENNAEIAIAFLDALGYEGFHTNQKSLLAYIPENFYSETELEECLINIPETKTSYSVRIIEEQNWNAQWESSFDPVVISDNCVVRAPFHDAPGVVYDIVIEPKMSFGTGHHPTTELILREMLKIDFSSLTVADVGTGSGILAVLASKLGAAEILAFDNDVWSVENTIENLDRNNVKNCTVLQGSIECLDGKHFDCIIMNINRNFILENLPRVVESLNPKGMLMLSGILESDFELVNETASKRSMINTGKEISNGWLALQYVQK